MIRFVTLATACTIVAGVVGWTPAVRADQPLPVPEIEKIVRDYLMREPQVIYDAIQELQKRQQEAEAARAQAAIVERGDELFRDAGDPVVGSMVGKIRDMVDGDTQLRFVFKELPVLGPDSVTAAKAALAASKLDPSKYYDYHLALMRSQDITLATVLRLAGEQGYDVKALQQEMNAAWVQERLDANHALAEALTEHPPIAPRAWPEIDHFVREANQIEVMFHHQHAVPLIAELAQRGEQLTGVARMQADRRLIEDVAHAAQTRAEASRQPGSLMFTA